MRTRCGIDVYSFVGLSIVAALGLLGVTASEAQMRKNSLRGRPEQSVSVAGIPHLDADSDHIAPELAADATRMPENPPMDPSSVETLRRKLLERSSTFPKSAAQDKGQLATGGLDPQPDLLPPDLRAMARGIPDTDPPAVRRSAEQLKQRYLLLPGKQEMIERMRRGKAVGWLDAAGNLLTWLNPLSVRSAEAQIFTPTNTTTVTVPQEAPPLAEWHADVENGWCVREQAQTPLVVDLFKANNFPRRGFAYLSSTDGGRAVLTFQASVAGNYLVSFSAHGGSGAKLERYVGGRYLAIETWPGLGHGWQDYVTAVYLSPGRHRLYLKPASYLYMSEVTVAQVSF